MSRYYKSVKDPVSNDWLSTWVFHTSGFSVSPADNVVEFPQITLGSDYINYPILSPTRVLVKLPGQPYSNGTFQVKVNSVTFGEVAYTATLTTNTFKIFPHTNDNTAWVELHAASVSSSDVVDFYGNFVNTVMHDDDANDIDVDTVTAETFIATTTLKTDTINGVGLNAININTNYQPLFCGGSIATTGFWVAISNTVSDSHKINIYIPGLYLIKYHDDGAGVSVYYNGGTKIMQLTTNSLYQMIMVPKLTSTVTGLPTRSTSIDTNASCYIVGSPAVETVTIYALWYAP